MIILIEIILGEINTLFYSVIKKIKNEYVNYRK